MSIWLVAVATLAVLIIVAARVNIWRKSDRAARRELRVIRRANRRDGPGAAGNQAQNDGGAWPGADGGVGGG